MKNAYGINYVVDRKNSSKKSRSKKDINNGNLQEDSLERKEQSMSYCKCDDDIEEGMINKRKMRNERFDDSLNQKSHRSASS